jgi:hypothetical protein
MRRRVGEGVAESRLTLARAGVRMTVEQLASGGTGGRETPYEGWESALSAASFAPAHLRVKTMDMPEPPTPFRNRCGTAAFPNPRPATAGRPSGSVGTG